MRTVTILGCTGSVGESTIKVLAELAATHRVVGLVARGSVDAIVAQAEALRPRVVGLIDDAAAAKARARLAGGGIEVIGGADAAVDVLRATEPDIVLAAITGAAGLASSLETVKMGKTLALANKEALVLAGHLLMQLARETGSAIVPVDSEHSAIYQALHGEPPTRIRRIFLTASGGPFVDLPAAEFPRVTPAAALQHPTWKMGPKITIDSATMMNKALEIVEARWLFATPAERIRVLVHRQSIVHSMLEFVDGSMIAQLGVPSMTVPIRYALCHPERAATREDWFDAARFANLTFAEPDLERFPALRLGFAAAAAGGLAGTVLNAANEVAVDRFLAGKASFDAIPATVERVLDRMQNETDPPLERILAADAWARGEARRCMD